MENDLIVVPIHKIPEYLPDCCSLINAEWKRSDTARMRSLENSCDYLPVNLILLQNKQLIGHLKLSKIPSIPNSCFVETVVIGQKYRGQGYGTYLMREAEKYCKNLDLDIIYLSTKGQEQFYEKLGYVNCQPISIYGSFGNSVIKNTPIIDKSNLSGPPPPPLPKFNTISIQKKTYMCKNIKETKTCI